MIIGIVTSTKFSDQLRDAFLNGLRISGWEGDPGTEPGGKSVVNCVVYEADGKYDDGEGGSGMKTELYNAVSRFDADSSVNLIVGVGGLVTAHAIMKKCSNKPFLLLYGTKPGSLPCSPRPIVAVAWIWIFAGK